MAYLRLLLLPFSLLYGLAIWIRNRFYDLGWLKSVGFSHHPVIVVGNLAVGGTGKSPMTEYLIRLLASHYKLATLSRGYGRATRGFLEVRTSDTAMDCGDEPLQFKRKFPDITVVVGEDRVKGVARLIQEGHEAVILDDAFQHRALRPGLAILLFDYQAMQRPRWLLPAGNYRDCFQERRRADVMVVTKTPASAAAHDKARIRQKLAVTQRVPVLFSSIGYGPLSPIVPSEAQDKTITLHPTLSVLMVTGIANPIPFQDYVTPQVGEVILLRYPDHHQYTSKDVQQVIKRFNEIANPQKLVITTEKDAQRLAAPQLASLLADLPVYMIPIQAQFDDADEGVFQQLVLKYCKKALLNH